MMYQFLKKLQQLTHAIALLKNGFITAYRRRQLPSAKTVNVPILAVLETPTISAIEMEALQVAESVSLYVPVSSPPEPKPEIQSLIPEAVAEVVPLRITQTRAVLVHTLLDEAWELGYQTYPALIDYVQRHTGEGCSRRAIANWKKARGLVQAA
jgi:hypothetical protein